MENLFSRFHAVIFDFDGVIADTEWLHSETFRKVLAEEGVFITDEDHDERFLGINDRAAFRMALAEVGRTAGLEYVQGLVARKSAYFSGRLDEVQVYPGVLDLVEELSGRRPLAIASGGRRAEIESILRAHGLGKRFLALISADDVAQSKPAPDAFLEALRALNAAIEPQAAKLLPAGCLVIEDSLHGIRAAKAAGMPCAAVANTYPREKLLEADWVFRKLGELKAWLDRHNW